MTLLYRYVSFFLAMFFVGLMSVSIAQQSPPAAYASGTNVNYIRTWDAVKPDGNASIALPIKQSASADSLLSSLDTLAANRLTQLAVVTVPAFEDGYNEDLKSSLLQWDRSKLDIVIIITGGVYTRKSSGSQQDTFFNWLTRVTENGTFDQDITGPGFKFITDENGKLKAVLNSRIKIHGSSLQRILQGCKTYKL